MDVLLNEVLYDPEGSDGGYEFVELAARAGAAADAGLAGWTLETGNGADGVWRVAWVGAAGDRLQGGLFVIGESGVDPRPHAVADLDLQNGPDACRLRSPSGEIDAVGWGADLPAGFFETAAAADVSGASLARLPDGVDSDANAADFRAAAPSPGDYNAPPLLVLVESWGPPPPDAPAGSEWTFTALLRNAGRLPWSGPLPVRCAIHPQETLAGLVADAAVMPGEFAEASGRAWPPPGAHLPRLESAAQQPASPWWGGGEDLAISEVFAHPSAEDAEWVEFRSVADQAIDLSLLELRDAADAGGALHGVLSPRAFAIATQDSALFVARWPVPANTLVFEPSSWPSLNHTGKAAEVSERLEVRVASAGAATEGASGASALLAGASLPGGLEESVSWERISLGLSAADVSSWAESLDPSGATPGRENSRPAERVVLGASGALIVTPSPFRPWRDGAALVVWRPAQPVASCRMTVHDSAGRVVASLKPWLAEGGEHRAVWDGRTDGGDDSALGMYLVATESPGLAGPRATLVLVR